MWIGSKYSSVIKFSMTRRLEIVRPLIAMTVHLFPETSLGSPSAS